MNNLIECNTNRIVQIKRMATGFHSLYKFGIIASLIIAKCDFLISFFPFSDNFRSRIYQASECVLNFFLLKVTKKKTPKKVKYLSAAF